MELEELLRTPINLPELLLQQGLGVLIHIHDGQRPLEKPCSLHPSSSHQLGLSLAIFSSRQLFFTQVLISLGPWDS